MSVFDPIDPVITLAAYGVFLLLTVAWIFLSSQKLIDRSLMTVFRVAVRLGLVFGISYVCFLYAPRISWLVSMGLAIVTVCGVMVDIPVSGVFSFALLYIIQQFVLGFPARHEWILSHPGELSPEQETKQRLSPLVGQAGVTVSPLRPIGEVQVGETVCSARTIDGGFLDPNVQVKVVAFQTGKLVVRVFEMASSETVDVQ